MFIFFFKLEGKYYFIRKSKLQMWDKLFLRSRVFALSSVWSHTLTLFWSVQYMEKDFPSQEDFVVEETWLGKIVRSTLSKINNWAIQAATFTLWVEIFGTVDFNTFPDSKRYINLIDSFLYLCDYMYQHC